jgi:hypothetical protein
MALLLEIHKIQVVRISLGLRRRLGQRNARGSWREPVPTCFSPGCQKHVPIPVKMVASNPAVDNRGVDPPLEIAISHLEELMAPQNSADSDVVSREHREDLPGCVVVCAHDAPLSPIDYKGQMAGEKNRAVLSPL